MSLILALHSSSNVLGIASYCLGDKNENALKVASFPLRRRLSNDLLTCIESVIPAKNWKQLVRLAVATGPGGFTSTRLTVAVARILAQQLECPLDGVNSLFLAAHRFRTFAEPFIFERPFWLTQRLSPETIVAGCYIVDPLMIGGVRELVNPRLIRLNEVVQLEPRLNVQIEVEKDVVHLLRLSQIAMSNGSIAPWDKVTPLYLTSPLNKFSI
uniref:Gcp-like domain-containing protein n=1 Tax=Paulinella longichromatophora TaxID=1708747 RepID=A0A2H4ZP43_9EUKA|nr:hypothetical protein PLO_307 [Paulinella longichromatophora]